MSTDHGYEVDEGRRCVATTKKQRQCSMPALVGSTKCALHSGLARPKRHSAYGDPQALEAYKRSLVQREQTRSGTARPRAGL